MPMLESEKMAIAAHLHVAMRRRLGRVTDVEWLVRDPTYAREIVALALRSEHTELHEWAHKLAAALFAQPAAPRAQVREPAPLARTEAGRRYIGGLR